MRRHWRMRNGPDRDSRLMTIAECPTWHMTIAKRDLIAALGMARTRATLRKKDGAFELYITLTAGPDGLSVRSSFAGMDIAGEGVWASPIMVPGAALKRIVPKAEGPMLRLGYADGRLSINQTWVSAREA